MLSEIDCHITGKVQRVGFRAFVEMLAKEAQVCGWVKNNDDGTVRVVMQGFPDVLKQCIARLYEGSVLSQVDDISVEWRTVKETYDEFTLRS